MEESFEDSVTFWILVSSISQWIVPHAEQEARHTVFYALSTLLMVVLNHRQPFFISTKPNFHVPKVVSYPFGCNLATQRKQNINQK